MADELDARLETRLREALRLEAASLPLLVREHDLSAALRRRRTRRWGVPASLAAAVAVFALLVAGGWVDRLGVFGPAASPAPSATLAPLASYEDLLALIGPDATALLRGERAGPAPDAAEVDLGTIPPVRSLAVGVSCLGGSIDLVLGTAGQEPSTIQLACSLRPYVAPFLGLDPTAGGTSLTVRAPAGVRWRVVVAEGGPVPSVIPLPSYSPIPLARLEDLVALIRGQGRALEVLLESEHLTDDSEGGTAMIDVGAVGPHDSLAFALSCTRGWMEVRVMAGNREAFHSRIACDASPTLIVDGTGSTEPEHRVLVESPLEASWRIVVAR